MAGMLTKAIQGEYSAGWIVENGRSGCGIVCIVGRDVILGDWG